MNQKNIMRYLLFIILSLGAISSQAQISATTASGAKVVLNTDGTWKYADGNGEVKPCSQNHTGNVSVKNATDNDIYFYYATNAYDKAQFVKIKANSTRTIYDLYVGYFDWQGKLTETHAYKWKALQELIDNPSSFTYIKGATETGSFMVDECAVKEVSIGE